MSTTTNKITKPKRGRRKKTRIKKSELDFLASPIEGDIHCEAPECTGSPLPVPAVKIRYDTRSKWVSPEPYTEPTRRRGATRLVFYLIKSHLSVCPMFVVRGSTGSC